MVSYRDLPPGRLRGLTYNFELQHRRRNVYDEQRYDFQLNRVLIESLNSYKVPQKSINMYHFYENTDVIVDKYNVNFCCVCQNTETRMLMRKINNCNHIFHIKCLETWVKTSSICPLCRITI